jgi:hypothetical protein
LIRRGDIQNANKKSYRFNANKKSYRFNPFTELGGGREDGERRCGAKQTLKASSKFMFVQ